MKARKSICVLLLQHVIVIWFALQCPNKPIIIVYCIFVCGFFFTSHFSAFFCIFPTFSIIYLTIHHFLLSPPFVRRFIHFAWYSIVINIPLTFVYLFPFEKRLKCTKTKISSSRSVVPSTIGNWQMKSTSKMTQISDGIQINFICVCVCVLGSLRHNSRRRTGSMNETRCINEYPTTHYLFRANRLNGVQRSMSLFAQSQSTIKSTFHSTNRTRDGLEQNERDGLEQFNDVAKNQVSRM